MTDTHLTDTSFADLGLPEELMRGLAATGFEYCTPIQAESLPPLLRGEDVAGQAQTGTGKTAAFLLATFTHLMGREPADNRHKTQPRALILAPTRELAIQIHSDAIQLGRYAGFKMVLVYGGTGYDQQKKELIDGVDILIGTPGRIIDYYRQGIFDLGAMEVAVLDEADRMFDLGFIKDVRYMLKNMPEPDKRLNMLFSATLSHRVAELAYEHMNEPTEVKIESEKLTADNVRERAFYPSNEEKIPLLLGMMRDIDAERVVVFVNPRHMTEKVHHWLAANGTKSGIISGDVPQKKRERLLEEFKAGNIKALVATDVAARGLHIPDVSHVINFDLPQDAEDYVHRIGRTARAGASGEAISFACEQYAFSMVEIEQYIGHSLPVESVVAELMMDNPVVPKRTSSSRDRGGRSQGGRPGGGRSGGGRPQGGRGGRRNEGSSSGRGPRPERKPASPRPSESESRSEIREARASGRKDGATPIKRPKRRDDSDTPAIG